MIITLMCLDVVFTVTIGYTFFATMEISGDSALTAIAVGAALWIVKVIVWMLIVLRNLQPLTRWFVDTKAPTDPDTIRDVAIAIYRAPFVVSVTWAVSFAGTCMLHTILLYLACADSVPLGPRSIEAQVFSNLGVLLGAAEMIFPLAEWLLAPMTESVSLTVQQHNVVIPERGMTFRSRLVAFALMLALAPSLFLSGIAYMRDARAEQLDLSRRAELAAAEAALSHDQRTQVADGWVFTFDAGAHITGREAAQALAEHPHLSHLFERAAAESPTGIVAHPREGVVAFRTQGDRKIGVVVPHIASVSFGTLILIVMSLLVIALWGPLSAMFIGNSTAVPVVRISDALARVGEGEVASAPKVPVFHQDEVGALAKNYNVMLDQLREFSRRVTEVSKGSLDVDLHVRGDLGDAFRDQVNSLRDIVGHIAQSALQLAGAATEMYAAAQEQEATAQQQSIGVEEVAQTMESLLAAATHVTESTTGVLTRAERTRETTLRTAERIAELSAHAGRIGEILDVIREIADRSDLLALNASLEGARAGEAGRGFALVANEMRKLAERVTASVTDIKKLVADVRGSVSATVIATEESTKLAEGTAESARQINMVTQQQRSGTEQAGQSMRDVASMITQSLAATQQIRSLAEDLKVQADNLTKLVARFRLPEPHAETRA
ncbi:MAG TPA: HAMP domain-containing methyl-accepting chemotaxis protein [Kofleriaceae bacterium]|jgi:methyl-accepting chemotaxis protein|nr:HAMP domain-containing methyl-accepting chemotaxis protein [Kofleriaceae bacterium]